MNRNQAINLLLENINSLRCWRDYNCGQDVVKFRDSDEPLPPYIPQIGEKYFDDGNRPRILMYAMNQNLNSAPKEVSKYSDLKDQGMFIEILNRLNPKATKGVKSVQDMGPYPHFNLLAAILISIAADKTGISLEETFERTACTNLIKCSTATTASTPNPQMYKNCIQTTCLDEIRILAPDIILAMSDDVFNNLTAALEFQPVANIGKYSVYQPGHDNAEFPRIILSVYHSTGRVAGLFKKMQRYFEEGGNRPKRFRPFIKMLTGADYNGSPEYWEKARAEYFNYKELLKSSYPNFFDLKEWYGKNDEYLFYFACHYGSFKNALSETEFLSGIR